MSGSGPCDLMLEQIEQRLDTAIEVLDKAAAGTWPGAVGEWGRW
jgi:hypothetical protein